MTTIEGANDCPEKVLLVEDNKITRQYLEKTLAQQTNFHINTADTYKLGKELLASIKPDFLVLDIGLPDGSGLDLITPALAVNPDMMILILTVFGEDASVIHAIQAGAKGYLLKDQALEEIGEALISMQHGNSPIDHRVARALLELVSVNSGNKQDAGFELSQNEKIVLGFIAQGRMYKEIAFEMDISINTVREYIRRIYKKLHVNSRFDAVQRLNEYNISLN